MCWYKILLTLTLKYKNIIINSIYEHFDVSITVGFLEILPTKLRIVFLYKHF